MYPDVHIIESVSPSNSSTSESFAYKPSPTTGRYRHEPYASGLIFATDSEPSINVSLRHGSGKFISVSSVTCSSSANSLGSLPGPILANTPVYVNFKYGRMLFQAPFPLHVGDMVVVEGDRGEDLGYVEEVAVAYPSSRVAKVLRKATPHDERKHQERCLKEKEALQNMRKLAAEVSFNGCVEDVMIQLDGKKITAIISRTSTEFIDFRNFQRAAYDVYRCRIWFAYLDEIRETKSTEMVKPSRRKPHYNRKTSKTNKIR